MVVAHIFHAEGSLRHYIYLSVLLFLFGYATIALWVFSLFALFYWDEFKLEFLDREDFMEECLDLFELNLDRHLRAISYWDEITSEYYDTPGKEKPKPEHMRTAASSYDPGSSYDRTADFEGDRWINLFDHPDAYPIFMASEWLEEEWEWVAETDLEPTCQMTMEDLELAYMYHSKSRAVDLQEEMANKHLTYTKDLLPLVVSPHSAVHQLSAVSPLTVDRELRRWLRPSTDFRTQPVLSSSKTGSRKK